MSSSAKSSHPNNHLLLHNKSHNNSSLSPSSDPNLEIDYQDIRISDSYSCHHLLELRSRLGPNPFSNIQDCLKIRPLGRASIRREPAHEVVRCGSCNQAPPRLYACVACAAVSCYLHAPSHAAELAGDDGGSSHAIAVDVDRAELFCCVCKDQVYDRDFDAAVVVAQTAASTIGSISVPPPPHPAGNLRKRRRVEYKPWAPDLKEQALIVEKSSPLPSQPVRVGESDWSELPWGLRGLNNLGNTCFMNSVLQALIHTPPLRNYFLSDKHNRYFCQKKNNVNQSNNKNCNNYINKNAAAPRLCLACDLDAVFSAVFSGDRTPYTPAKFLYSWWQHASNLASYEQQDAHEFFISILDGIHEKMQNDGQKLQSQGSGDCCIAHRVFSGILRSDVMCTACGFTSTTYDPCIDISLDLEPNLGASSKPTSGKSNACNGEADSANSSQSTGVSTLRGCLDRFTRPETLGSDQKFFCQQCQVRQESLKQMSIRKLPLVSCFHIKRFEHSHIKKVSRKVDRYLQFPFSLDMAPYLSSSVLRRRFGNRLFPFDGDEPDADSSELSSEFELFAVITHTGKLDAGHYITYLRLSNQWYKCDDAWITQVNDNIVRAAQGYMIFYVQKMLYYRASERQVAS